MSSVDSAASGPARPRRQKAPPSIDDSPIQRLVRLACLGLLGAAVLVVLLTHGGVYPAAVAIGLILMCASLAIGYVALGVRTSVSSVFHFVLGVWAVVLAWSLIQSMPLPDTIPGHPAWKVLAELGMGDDHYLSSARARVWLPRHMVLGKFATIGPDVEFYNMAPIRIGDRTVISQRAHLCAGTHDVSDPDFQLIARPIDIGSDVWIAAEAFVGPGVTVGDGVVLAARGCAFKDLEPWNVYRGNPAALLRPRTLHGR